MKFSIPTGLLQIQALLPSNHVLFGKSLRSPYLSGEVTVAITLHIPGWLLRLPAQTADMRPRFS